MLNVEAPANFVLTLQSVPPFLVENILALALVVLLAVPLIAHIQILLDNATKDAMGASTRRPYQSSQRQDPKNRTVVMHYPIPVTLDTRSNSDVNIQLGSMRTTCSTPTVKRSAEKLPNQRTSHDQTSQDDHCKQIFREMMLRRQKTCLPLKRSSSFLATNAQLPIIDISAFDYDCYRHKLIEMTLKRQYGDRQAPGNVVFNSIHLNSVGSESHIQLSEKYSHSLFDFIEEYYDATKTMSKKEKEYLHPLDHFLVKSSERPGTAETGTETKESSAELDQVPEMITFRDDSPIRTASLTSSGKRKIPETSKHASKLTIRSRRSSSIPRNPSQALVTSKPNLSNVEKSPLGVPATQQLFNRTERVKSPENRNNVFQASQAVSKDGIEEKKIFGSSRTSRSRTPRGAASSVSQANKISQKLGGPVGKRDASFEPGKSSCESFAPGGIRPGEYSEALSTDHDDKESVTCASSEFVSSSEAGSSYCSSRPREKRLRSRASSLSSKSRTIRSPSQTRQWHSGNANATFDRPLETLKPTAGKIGKTKLCVRPRSTGGRFAWDVPDVPAQCDEATEEKLAAPAIPERPKTANAATNRRRTPEKGKLSETVLPVLESVIDLRVDVNCDGFDEVDVGNELDGRENAKGISKPRDFKRVARSSGKKLSSASFVKSPVRNSMKSVAAQEKMLPAEKSGVKAPDEVATRSSSGIKTPSSRPGSVSRLPVHVGADKTKMRKFIEDRQICARKPGDLLEKNSAGVCEKSRRPRTAGCVRTRPSSLSPKIELSLETLPVVAGVTIEKLQTPEGKKSSRHATGAHPSGQMIIPVSKSNASRATNAASSRGSKDCTDLSIKGDQQDGSPKRPFLRARSGRYGAPKLDTLEKKPKDSTKQEAPFSSKLDEEEKTENLLKLPRKESNAALVMRRELKIYIKKIKHILSNRDKHLQAKDLASLSITEAIISELRDLLSPREIQDLQKLMDREEISLI